MRSTVILFIVFIVSVFVNLNIYRIGSRRNSFRQYAGKYLFARENRISEGEISSAGDSALRLKMPSRSVRLKKIAIDRFKMEGNRGDLSFVRSSSGQITGLILSFADKKTKNIEGRKIYTERKIPVSIHDLAEHTYAYASE